MDPPPGLPPDRKSARPTLAVLSVIVLVAAIVAAVATGGF